VTEQAPLVVPLGSLVVVGLAAQTVLVQVAGFMAGAAGVQDFPRLQAVGAVVADFDGLYCQ